MSRKAILNGELMDSETIPMGIASQGLALGFGLFETIKFQGERPCFLSEHYQRLVKSADAVSMKFPYSLEDVYRQSLALFETNAVEEGVFKILLTRTDSRDDTIVYLRDTAEMESAVPIRLRQSEVIKASQAFTSRNKTVNYLENLLEKAAAQKLGFDECFFLNEAGFVTECAMANLFIIKEGLLRTPSADCGLLKGVIRGQVLRIAREMGLRVEVGKLLPSELSEADEVFLTSSGKGISNVSEMWIDQLYRLPVVGSKLVDTLKKNLRIAEVESTKLFEE